MHRRGIYWDIDERRLIEGLSSPTQVRTIYLPARDIVPIYLYPCTRTTADEAYTCSELASGETLIFSAKTGLADTNVLFQCSTWTWDSTEEAYYGDVDLSTTELIAAVANKRTCAVLAELAIVKSTRHYHSTSVRCVIENDVNRAEETPASMSSGLEFFTDESGNKCVRIKNADGETIWTGKPTGA